MDWLLWTANELGWNLLWIKLADWLQTAKVFYPQSYVLYAIAIRVECVHLDFSVELFLL